jgi:hypothetical protein
MKASERDPYDETPGVQHSISCGAALRQVRLRRVNSHPQALSEVEGWSVAAACAAVVIRRLKPRHSSLEERSEGSPAIMCAVARSAKEQGGIGHWVWSEE